MKRKFTIKASTNKDSWKLIQEAAQRSYETGLSDLYESVEEKYGLSQIEQEVQQKNGIQLDFAVQNMKGDVFIQFDNGYRYSKPYMTFLKQIYEAIMSVDSKEEFAEEYFWILEEE